MTVDPATSEDSTPADILRAAARRIDDRQHFVMGALAWNRKGREVEPQSPDAWRWNARGALVAECGMTRAERLYALVQSAAKVIAEEIGQRQLLAQDTTDNIGHALTLRALEDAARLSEAQS